MTQARTDVNVQSTPWVSKSGFSQGGTAQRIFGIDAGLVSADATPVGANGAKISDSNAQSYATYIGIGNYQGTFQGNVENNTGSFASSVRSDLYELRPATGNPVGTYLGFFELSPTGTLSFSSAAVVNAVPDSGSCMIFGGVLLSLIGLKRVSASRE